MASRQWRRRRPEARLTQSPHLGRGLSLVTQEAEGGAEAGGPAAVATAGHGEVTPGQEVPGPCLTASWGGDGPGFES